MQGFNGGIGCLLSLLKVLSHWLVYFLYFFWLVVSEIVVYRDGGALLSGPLDETGILVFDSSEFMVLILFHGV